MPQDRLAETLQFIRTHRVALAPGHPDGYGGELINKVPCVPNPAKTASDDPDIIKSWLFSDENRTMFLPCGSRNNILVVDCDNKDGIDGHAQFLEYCKRHNIVPSPIYQDSPSGGRHYFYRYDPRCYGNRTKITLDNQKVNIDIKSEGGLIRVDPRNKNYRMTGCLTDVPTLPECLVEEIKANPPDPYGCDDTDARNVHEYLQNVNELLEAACLEIARAGTGERNDTVNRISYLVGRELAAGNPTEWETAKERLLTAAIGTGLNQQESLATINGAFNKGVERGGFRANERVPRFMRSLKFVRENMVEEDGIFRRLPDTPVHLLGKNAMDVIKVVSKNRKVPVEMTMGLLLGLVSVCIGNACNVRYDRNWKEYANLFLLFVGESGIGKSLAYAIIFESLLERQGDLKDRFAEERQEYETKLAEWRKAKKGQEVPKPIPPRNIQYVLNDSTIEGAIELLRDNPRGVSWYIDEGRKFFSRLDRYTNNSGDGRSKLLSGWDTQPLSVMRKTHNNESQEIYIKKGTFSLISGIQPSFVPEFISNEDAEQGLTQRFLFIRAQEKQPPTYPLDEIPEEIDMRLRLVTNKLLRLADLGEARARLRRENNATAFIEGFSEEENQWPTEFFLDKESKLRMDQDMTRKARTTFGTEKYSYAKKSNRQTLRLALILHLISWAASDNDALTPNIGYETLQSAIKLIGWFSQHLDRILSLMPQQTKGKKVDNGTLNEIAMVILEHREEIENSGNRFIPNAIWKKWLFDKGLCLSNKSMRYMLDELHSVSHHTSGSRGRVFTLDCLNYCEKLCEEQDDMFSDEKDEQFDPASEARKRIEAEKTRERKTRKAPKPEDVKPPKPEPVVDEPPFPAETAPVMPEEKTDAPPFGDIPAELLETADAETAESADPANIEPHKRE